MATFGGIADPATISDMLRSMPDGVDVFSDGKKTGGIFEHVPDAIFDEPGHVTSRPSVVIAAGSLPGIGLDDQEGSLRGIGRTVTISSELIAEAAWAVTGIEPATAPGEIRLLLSNVT